MKKYNLYIITFGFFLNSYIYSMEEAPRSPKSPKKFYSIKKTLSKVETHNSINTMEELTKFVNEKKGTFTAADLDANDINPDLAAKLMVSLGLEYDGQLPMHGTFLKSVRSLPQKDVERSRRLKKTLFEQAYIHDGTLTAGSITQRKKDIMTASSQTASGKTTSGKTGTTDDGKEKIKEEKEKIETNLSKKLRLNMEDIKNPQIKENKKNNGVLYDEELEKAKQEMRELILAAADEAIKAKDWESTRNALIGAGTTIITAIAGPIATYFISQPDDCPPSNNNTSV